MRGWRHLCLLAVLFACSLPSLAQQAQTEDDSFTALLHQGFDLHQRAEYANALPLLQRAWKLDPHDYFVNLLLGIDLLRTHKPEPAIGFLAEASRLRPKEDFPYEYQGEAQALLGHYAEAAAAYLKAIAVSPDSPEAIEGWVDYSLERFRQLAGVLRSSQTGLAAEYRLQARSYAVGDPKSRRLLEQSGALDPEAPGIWSELALANLAGGDVAEARRSADRAIAANASDLRAMEAEALLAANSGDWIRAGVLLNAIGAHAPSLLTVMRRDWPASLQPTDQALLAEPAANFLRCVKDGVSGCAAAPLPTRQDGGTLIPGKLFQEQRWDRLAALREPSKTDAESWFRRGVALAQMERCNQAIPALELSLTEANVVYARFLLSWCYADAAGKADARIPESGGDQALSHMVRGDVLLRMQGDTTGAISEYQAALTTRANDPKLLERLAEAQISAGNFDAAAKCAHAALKLDPHRYSATQTLARVAMEQGKYDEALPQLKELAAENPKDIGTQISLVTALAQTGASAEALQILRPILAAGYPDEKGNLHSTLGALLRKTGQPQEAAAAYARARQLSEEYQQSSHRGQEEPK